LVEKRRKKKATFIHIFKAREGESDFRNEKKKGGKGDTLELKRGEKRRGGGKKVLRKKRKERVGKREAAYPIY